MAASERFTVETSAEEIVDRYFARLIALANRRLSRQVAVRADAEDVTQSALRSFFAAKEQYPVAERDVGQDRDSAETPPPFDLWPLLAAIVVNKCKAHIRRHRAAKRDVRRERPGDLTESSPGESADAEASPSRQIMLVEAASALLKSLTPAEQRLIDLKLTGATPAEITDQLDVSPRTARRRLAELRAKLEERFADSAVKLRPGTIHRTTSEKNSPATTSPTALRSRRLDATFQEASKQLGRINFDDLLLEQMIGAGGMGKVFRAVDKRSGETVAVKALAKRHQENHEAMAAFLREALVTAGLCHRGIVPLRAIGRFPAGGLFMVMKYVRGRNLAEEIVSRPIPIADIVRMGVAVAEAIDSAHQQGVVHCDMKPANILIATDGTVFVTDFGFAALMRPMLWKSRLASLGDLPAGGTLAFAAPEQRDAPKPGHAGDSAITPATDVYSLGKVLLAMLPPTSRFPTTPEETSKTLAEDLALVKSVGDVDVPADLIRVIKKCTMIAPHDRFASAREFADALKGIV